MWECHRVLKAQAGSLEQKAEYKWKKPSALAAHSAPYVNIIAASLLSHMAFGS